MSCLNCKENINRFTARIEGYPAFTDTTDYLYGGKIILMAKENRVLYRECTTCRAIWVEQNTVTELKGDPYNGYEKVYTDVRARVLESYEIPFIQRRAALWSK